MKRNKQRLRQAFFLGGMFMCSGHCAVTANASTLDTEAPVVTTTVSPGTYAKPFTLKINVHDNDDASPKVYYTMDGSLPSWRSGLYSGRELNVSETQNDIDLYLRTLAKDKSGNWVRNSFKYRVLDSSPPVVTPSVAGGYYGDKQNITLSVVDASDPSPVIYYTVDGSLPTKKSAKIYTSGSIIEANDIGKKLDLRLRTLAVDSKNNYVRNTYDYYIGENKKPVVDFTIRTNGLTAYFDASGSYDPDGKISLFYWGILPEVKSLTGKQILYAFNKPGTYQIILDVIDEIGAYSEVTKSITITADKISSQALGQLNDTGITSCYFLGGASKDCYSSGALSTDDAAHGRDSSFTNDDSDGHAGFSFTKVDGNGYPLSSSSEQWSCVLDNVTGLLWELKTSDGGLHDATNTFTWYNPDGTKNGGAPGVANGGSCTGGIACDAQGYIAAVNSEGLCGQKNWRLPTADELYNLVDLGVQAPETKIDKTYFPYVSGDYASSSLYTNGPELFRTVSFTRGQLFFNFKSNPVGLILVSGDKASK